jgi:hypothetical protein
MRRWIEHTQRHKYSTAMPPCIVSQNRNNPDFHDNLVDGSYSVEVVLEREVSIVTQSEVTVDSHNQDCNVEKSCVLS